MMPLPVRNLEPDTLNFKHALNQYVINLMTLFFVFFNMSA